MNDNFTVAFFPWVCLDAMKIGPFSLVPWDRAASNCWQMKQTLQPYVDAALRPVERATQVVLSNGQQDWTEELIGQLFEIRELVSFTALARRRFFDAMAPYCNDASFRCVVQRGRSQVDYGVTISCRRRDETQLVVRQSAVYRVPAPDQVTPNQSLFVDRGLLEALLASTGADSCLLDAVALFNLANTDDSQVREHTELLLLTSAIQRVTGSGVFREDAVVAAFEDCFRGISPLRQLAMEAARRKHGGPPTESDTALGRWFRDLYRSRNPISHGKISSALKPRWSVQEHLLLGAVAFPLCVLYGLSAQGRYNLTEDDRLALRWLEELACRDDIEKGWQRRLGDPGTLQNARDAGILERVIEVGRSS